jgi:hypothetical protein
MLQTVKSKFKSSPLGRRLKFNNGKYGFSQKDSLAEAKKKIKSVYHRPLTSGRCN